MNKIREKLKGLKTYILGALGIITTVATYLVGDIELGQAGELIWTAVLAMTIRAGVTTEIKKATEE